ncbi:cold-shock protein [Erythrobacter litoralis]|uniref:cold-shock protein n=1 Tax=Erythrobacter litoralis TaxID=39960 RepID=UPI002435FC83|nr:cold-shock protein [Erythrobacter litoralis]MDG6080005.1 cold-shock protein [Erythrobacter litoralis]
MGYDRGRRRGRDKRDGFGEDSFDPFGGPGGGFEPQGGGYGGGDRFGGGGDRFGGGGDRFGGGNRGGGGGFGGGNRGGGGGFGGGNRGGGGEDIFVHISAVERAGLEGLGEGQELEFNLVDRGGKVSAQDLQIVGDVVPVNERGSGGAPAGRDSRDAAPRRELTGEKATGTVKFFNSMKGFGFLTRDDGQPDAFVHISAVERSGLSGLNEGERYEFDLEVDRRGKHSAVNLVPAD